MWEGRRELGLRGRNEQVTKLTEAPGRGGGRGRKAWRLTGKDSLRDDQRGVLRA